MCTFTFKIIFWFNVLFQQKVAFKHFPDLQRFAIANVASVDTRAALTKYFKSLR